MDKAKLETIKRIIEGRIKEEQEVVEKFKKHIIDEDICYGMRWYGEDAMRAEGKLKILIPLLVRAKSGELSVDDIIEGRNTLQNELVSLKPWRHTSTGYISNLENIIKADVTAYAIDLFNFIIKEFKD